MILLDESADPKNTVYYISAKILEILKKQDFLDYSTLYKNLREYVDTSQTVYSLGLDFLFLIGKIDVNKKGKLYVIKSDKIG